MSDERSAGDGEARPRARLRPRGAAAKVRVAGRDAARWAGRRARGVGRLVRGAALAACLLAPVVLISVFHSEYRPPVRLDLDRDLARLRNNLRALEQVQFDAAALVRALPAQSALRDAWSPGALNHLRVLELDLTRLVDGFPAATSTATSVTDPAAAERGDTELEAEHLGDEPLRRGASER